MTLASDHLVRPAQREGWTYQSAGAPGIPLPGAGTSTAFLSSVSPTHCSTSRASRSTSSSVFSGRQSEGMSVKKEESKISTFKIGRFLLDDIHIWLNINYIPKKNLRLYNSSLSTSSARRGYNTGLIGHNLGRGESVLAQELEDFTGFVIWGSYSTDESSFLKG